ncbi:sigma factor-like helix-turn-helix DNA-binding protein [Arthrobacter sp. H14]|uniref:sigma factor-like helix-turn-helix DNA-binding protein n=1 Tax=Arthrobacter sp. H14 TaxID=1312959 RepID=UPI0020A676AB|nr:sigma factor-like helix-turn-helix DNA-binding protein [Arthrobacter sp. H14]
MATYTPDIDQTAETAINRLEEQESTRSLKTLSPTQRETINLVSSDGLTYQQVGAHLGIPLSTAKTRIRGGLIRVKSSIEHLTHLLWLLTLTPRTGNPHWNEWVVPC